MIYLDNAATTLHKPASVSRAAERAICSLASPGRGGYPAAMAAAETAFACREAAAELFHVDDPSRVVFTMNATHALNIAIKSLVGRGDRVVISGYEHNAVLRPLNALGAEIEVASSPLFDRENALAAFDERIGDETKAVVLTCVSNVFGAVLPFEEIAALCRSRGVPLILDASQAAGAVEVDFTRLGAAFIAMPGHKGLYGPQGTGLLLCGEEGTPLMEGGSGSESELPQMPPYLPDRLEAGTHNVPGIAGLLEGLRFVKRLGVKEIAARERQQLRLAVCLLRGLDRIQLYAAQEREGQAGVLSFTVDGMDSQSVAESLAKRGIAVRAGLHCAPLAHKTAGTFPDGTVRASFSAFTTEQDVRFLADALRRLCKAKAISSERFRR